MQSKNIQELYKIDMVGEELLKMAFNWLGLTAARMIGF
jgi:hypothetical protein